VSRGSLWFSSLAAQPPTADTSVLAEDVVWNSERLRLIAVVPNLSGKFPRARSGQVGIEEGWTIADAVHRAIVEDYKKEKRTIIAIVDVPGQAFGYHEEFLGLHESLAAAADAYASARLAGHPVIALVVGKAISGAFLAHGLQAASIIALDDAALEFHVMSQASAARVTRRGEAEVAALAKIVPSTARDVHSFASLGALDELLNVENADAPTARDVDAVKNVLLGRVAALRAHPRAPRDRLVNSVAATSRAMSIRVRKLLEEQWDAPA
jgi:malonate decarboxylase beta subunit